MAQNTPYLLKPGLHSYNVGGRTGITPDTKPNALSAVRAVLLIIGLGCLGYYGYTLADQQVYQVYENWAFEQEIAGRQGVTFGDYVREHTPLGFLARTQTTTASLGPASASTTQATKVTNGTVIGRVEIGRLNLSAVVRQGADDATLRTAVGHIPSTAMAGEVGNFAIAAHRDTLFRALKDIQKGDLVTFQSPTKVFSYEVVATKIVRPTDVSVIHPDGGGLIQPVNGETPDKLLTMITCYPFYFVGSAPKRFVVEARLVSGNQPK